jgi:hypothetical protein
VFATGRVRAFWVELGVGDGSSVGNRPAALPPGLRAGLAAGMPGRLPTGSGEVIIAGASDGLTVTVADAMGSFGR